MMTNIHSGQFIITKFDSDSELIFLNSNHFSMTMGILARANVVVSAMCLIFLIYVTEGKLFSRVRKKV
jgi:hypothetical protein